MELPVELLDKIFSFLTYYPRSLRACSDAHPIFTQIVQKYLYYHCNITPFTLTQSDDDGGYSQVPSRISKLLSETPQIVDYIRILEVSVERYRLAKYGVTPIFLKFCALQCIKLPRASTSLWIFRLP